MTETAIILAGGLGTRLRAVLPDTPKCLAPVGDTPFLFLLIDSLRRRGIEDIVLALGYKADSVIDALRNFDPKKQIRSVTESSPLGTGGAMLQAMRKTGLTQAIVLNGDTFFNGSLASLTAPLKETEGELCRMAILPVEDRARYGGIQLDRADSESGIVTGFREKGSSEPGWINAGYYRVHLSCFDAQAEGAAFSFEEKTLPALVARGHLSYTKLQGEMIDIGIPADYRRFCALSLQTSFGKDTAS